METREGHAGRARRARPTRSAADEDVLPVQFHAEGSALVIKELFQKLLDEIERLASLEPATGLSLGKAIRLRDETRRFETMLILRALAITGGRQLPAARLLGLRPTTLHETMKRYGIRPSDAARPG